MVDSKEWSQPVRRVVEEVQAALEWGDDHEGAVPMMDLVVVWRREFKEFGDWEAKGEKTERGGKRREKRKKWERGEGNKLKIPKKVIIFLY